MGLPLNSQKSAMLDDIFDFVVSESCDGGLLYSHNMWLLILILFFYFCDSCKFTNSNKKYWTQPTTTTTPSQLHKVKPKNQPPLPWWQLMQPANEAVISLATAHFGCCSCTNGCFPPSNNTGLFDCYLAGCTSHGTAQTMEKLKN